MKEIWDVSDLFRLWPLLHAPLSALLSFQEQRLRYLKQQEQRQQQQASEQEKLQRLRENIDNQETRLKKVRALKGQVEQKRLSNGKLGKSSWTDWIVWMDACSGFCTSRILNSDTMSSVLLSVFMTLSLTPPRPLVFTPLPLQWKRSSRWTTCSSRSREN